MWKERVVGSRRITAGVSVVIAALAFASCGGGSSSTSQPSSSSSKSTWPASLDNAKVAALYNTANDSSQVAECASADDQTRLGVSPSYAKVQGVGATESGPGGQELVDCTFMKSDTSPVGADVFIGAVGSSTWTNSSQYLHLPRGGLKVATTITGSGSLDLPYTRPDGWTWQIAYTANSPGEVGMAMALAHAVADELAAGH